MNKNKPSWFPQNPYTDEHSGFREAWQNGAEAVYKAAKYRDNPFEGCEENCPEVDKLHAKLADLENQLKEAITGLKKIKQLATDGYLSGSSIIDTVDETLKKIGAWDE